MIPVSNGWVAAHQETLLPEMFVEITYTATEPGIANKATVTSTSETSYSEASDVVSDTGKSEEKYATLEHGLWGLDGTFTYLDGDSADQGFISNALSGENGSFSVIPTINVGFATQRSVLIPGVTIHWGTAHNEWATDFRVTAYLGAIPVATTTVNNNTSPVSVVWMDLVDYNKITVEILRWSHPHHRARCTSLILGIQTVYHKNDLTGYEHRQSADLLSAALPKNEVVFRLRNEDNRWNPDNPTGSEQYLMEQQEIKVRYGMTVDGATEWIKGGTFWLSEWSTPSNGLEATFTARDALEFMNVEYTGPRSGSLYNIAQAAFIQANLPGSSDDEPRYRVDDALKSYTTNFAADTNAYTIAQILQMVAHAACCVFYQDRNGIMWITPWNPGYAGYMVDPHMSYSHPEYTISKPIKAISVGYTGNEEVRAIIDVSDHGEIQTVDSVMINTENDARRVGKRAKEVLENRKVISGDFRADVRLDTLDPVIVSSKYAKNLIAITDLTYSTTGGAFRGSYTGRVVSINLEGEDRRSGEFYVGELME